MAEQTVLERTHRFALVISGGVALGSYEAGVLAQFYRDVQDFNAHPEMQGKAKLIMDALAGASAGAITGLILAQAVALGHTADELQQHLWDCWVELLDIQHLLTPVEGQPATTLFSDAVVDTIVQTSLQIPPAAPQNPSEPIALCMVMTNLDGIPYVIDFERKDEYHAQASVALYALDYRDHASFLLNGSEISLMQDRLSVQKDTETPSPSSEEVWQMAVQAAKSSSAFPLAFPPQYQERDLRDYPEYMQFKEAIESKRLAEQSGEPGLQAQSELPTHARFQFVDGGLFHNEPIGKCVDAVNFLNQLYPTRDPNSAQSQGKVERSFVMIEPDPQLPAEFESALSNTAPPTDESALPSSVLGKILSAYFNTALYADFKTAAQMNTQIADLNTALKKLETLGLDAETVTRLQAEIRQAVGFQDKMVMTLQRIPHDLPPDRRLAGAFGGHFGGFLRRDFREADFLTGRHEARHWFTQWLMLWLQNHADDIGKTAPEITPEYVLSLLGNAPPDPATTPIAPTQLTPLQLSDAGWLPHLDANGQISETARLAALTPEERQKIVQMATARGELLLETWLNASPLVHFSIHLAFEALEHLFNKRFSHDPPSE